MIRLIFLGAFLLLSLLALFQAPTYHLWLLAILVTEFPFIFAGITMLLLAGGFWTKKHQLAGSIIGIVAFIIFLSPIFRSYMVGKKLKSELSKVFYSDKRRDDVPFSVSRMLTGVNSGSVEAKEHVYVPYQDKGLKLDFYSAKTIRKRPCVIVVHGGSWKSGDSKQLMELNAVLTSAGYHVAAVNYRLAPKHLSPAPVQDVKAAVSYLQKNADALQIDVKNIVLLGRSAGAQVALLAAYSLNITGLKGVISFYGPADMVWGYSLPANPLVMDSRKVMEDYLGGNYKSIPQKYAASSPINFVTNTSVPTLIIHGKNDVLVAYEHSTRLQKKLNDYGVKNYFLSLPWATHGFDYNINGPGGQLSTYAVLKFLDSTTL